MIDRVPGMDPRVLALMALADGGHMTRASEHCIHCGYVQDSARRHAPDYRPLVVLGQAWGGRWLYACLPCHYQQRPVPWRVRAYWWAKRHVARLRLWIAESDTRRWGPSR